MDDWCKEEMSRKVEMTGDIAANCHHIRPTTASVGELLIRDVLESVARPRMMQPIS
jgi:hypothetical protein